MHDCMNLSSKLIIEVWAFKIIMIIVYRVNLKGNVFNLNNGETYDCNYQYSDKSLHLIILLFRLEADLVTNCYSLISF